jgi:hypothetical protein
MGKAIVGEMGTVVGYEKGCSNERVRKAGVPSGEVIGVIVGTVIGSGVLWGLNQEGVGEGMGSGNEDLRASKVREGT